MPFGGAVTSGYKGYPGKWLPVNVKEKSVTLRALVIAAVVLVAHAQFGDAQERNGYTGGGPISPRAGNVETASLVTVNSVLRGKVSAGTELLIIELGGKQGQWNVIDPGNPLPQPGERYILFLHANTASIPNSAGVVPDSGVVPRYRVVGYANGKARIDANGNIQFGSGAKYDMLQYASVPSSSFVSTVAARIAYLFPPPLPYPVGVTPIPLPPNTITPLPAKSN